MPFPLVKHSEAVAEPAVGQRTSAPDARRRVMRVRAAALPANPGWGAA